MNEVERARQTLHKTAAALDNLTDPVVLRVADEMDRLVVEALKSQVKEAIWVPVPRDLDRRKTG